MRWYSSAANTNRRPSASEVALLPPLDRVEHRFRLGAGVRAHVGLAVEAAHAERDHARGLEPREAVEDAEQRVVEHLAVVHARAHDDLAVHLTPASSSAPSHRRLVAPRRLRSSAARTSGSVAWMLT